MTPHPDPLTGLSIEQLRPILDAQPYPLLFVTISGAHLYGFASPDSDVDLRGVHRLPAAEVLSLDQPPETLERSTTDAGLEIDLVTHDVEKFIRLMLKRNGYVLEQLLSPWIVHTTPTHDKLKQLARGCITRHHVHHYLGFARNQWKLFEKEQPPRVKPLLYVYRVLLTGLHLLRTGEVEANLITLNQHFRLSHIDDLIARKRQGSEHERLTDADLALHRVEFERLEQQLVQAGETTHLPEMPRTRDELSNLLVRLRLETVGRTQDSA